MRSKTQVHYCFVRRDQKKPVNDIKALPIEGCITQKKADTYDFKVRKLKNTNKQFIFRENIYKLHENNISS